MSESGQSPTQSIAIGTASICVGATSACWYLPIMVLDPWLLSRPFWFGLDRPAGYDQLMQTTNDAMSAATLTALAGLILAGWLIGIGVQQVRGAENPYIVRGWSIAKIIHALINAAIVYTATNGQLAGMPDPLTPQYTTGHIIVGGVITILVGFAIRIFWPLVLLLSAPPRDAAVAYTTPC